MILLGEFERNDDGGIHDRVIVNDGVQVVVIAGTDAADTCSMQISALALRASVILNPGEAATLGRLLIAASEDTLSRDPDGDA